MPGELYVRQRWAPWEQDPDCDPTTWWSQPACRWCAEQVWKCLEKEPFGDRAWSEEFASEWASEECHRWLRLAGEDYLVPEGGSLPDYRPRPEYREALRTAQREAAAFMFLRRFCPCPLGHFRSSYPAGYLFRCG